ncbi:MAG: ATP-binding protein [Microcoleaceae cyanobacterium]
MLNNSSVCIQFIDNDPGIQNQITSKPFDPFFTTKPVGKGTGLGRSMSYQIIVEKHQGKLSCDSIPGQETKFVIEQDIHLSQSEINHTFKKCA